MNTKAFPTTRSPGNLVRLILVSCALLMLAACASTGSTSRPSSSGPEPLEIRAKQRWDLLIAGKSLEAWEYLSPGHRQTRDAQRYADDMRNRPTRWLSAGVNSVECESEEVCVVVMRMEFEAPVPGRSGGARAEGWVRENWLRLDGTWYHVP